MHYGSNFIEKCLSVGNSCKNHRSFYSYIQCHIARSTAFIVHVNFLLVTQEHKILL